MSRLSEQIGLRLKSARKAANYKSARDFSSQYHIPETTYSQHEAGKRALKAETLIYYSRVLNVNPGWLLTGDHRSYTHEKKSGGRSSQRKFSSKMMSIKRYKKISQDQSLAMEEFVNIIDWNTLIEDLLSMDIHQFQLVKEYVAEVWNSTVRFVKKLHPSSS